MECFSERTCALFVDGELGADEARLLREHLATCQRCQRLVDTLLAENRLLRESLQELPQELSEEAASTAGFFRLRWSWVWGDVAALAALLALGSMVFYWFGELRIPAELEWLNPLSLGGGTNAAINISYYFGHGGTAMLANYAAVVGWLSLLLLLGGSAWLLGWRRLGRSGLLLLVLLTLSLPSFGVERRHGRVVTLAANETVDDTLIASGDTVRVEGVVNGDLLAGGRTVEVLGTVKGDLLTWAQRTEVRGTVEGHIYCFSQTLEVDGQLGQSIYAWAQSLRLDKRGQVGGSVMVGGADVNLEGDVKHGVNMFAGNADVSGSIGRDLNMAGGSLTLSDSARVGGNLSARVRELNDVHIANGAAIAGKRDIQLSARKSRFTRPRFYFYQTLWLAAAMLVGWLGLVLFPGFFEATTQAVGSGWRSLGLGVGVLAGAPVAMVVAAITLIGLPLSLILLAVYLVALYLAKLWVGAFLGRMILKPAGATKRDWLLGLLVGLLVLTIVGFIPYLGGLVRLGVACLGLGAFAWQLYRSSGPAMPA